MKPRAVTSSLLLLLSLHGCDGSGTGPGRDRVSSVTISPPTPIVEVGNTVQLSAVVQKANGTLLATPVTWSTSAASVATCSGTGLVAGVSEGTATVTATAGGVSGTVSISVIDPTTPTPPSGISAVPLSDTSIRVTWTDNSANEDEFRIDREPVAGGVSGTDGRPARVFAEAGIVGPGVTTFEDTGLDSETSYRYRVRACNENGCSDPSGHQTEIATFATLVIQTTTLPAGRTGQAYQQALTASGGNGIVAWSVSGGSLPNGLTLSGAGVLGGTPATAGVFQFSIQVVGAGQTVSREFSLTIQGVLTVTTTSLPDGVAGTAYNSLLQASGGDGTHTWSVIVGALPGGLTLAPSGILSGTPTATGDFPITVSVTSGGQVVVANFAIRIFDPLAITTGPLPDGMVGSAYSQILTATGGDGSYTWSVSSGVLPDGLTLGAASGAISGTSGTVGTFEFTVRISSSGLTASRAYSITIRPLLAVTTASLPSGRVGVIYSQFLQAAGGDGSFTWSLIGGALPDGLNLHPSSGLITGMPTKPGVFPFTVRVASGGLTASANLSIGTYSVLKVTTTSLPGAIFGRAYSVSLLATGGDGSYSWTVSGGTLPQGLSLSTDGTISGAPTWAGTVNFTVRVQSGDGQTFFKPLSIRILYGLGVTTTSLPNGQGGVSYSQVLTAEGGDGSYSWAIAGGSLPDGLSLDPGTGRISGTPTTAGTFNFTVQVASGDGQTVTAALSITIQASPDPSPEA